MQQSGNLSIRVAVSLVRPFMYIENGKIVITIKELQSILDLLPKNWHLKTVVNPDFQIGSPNQTGHYNGILGIVQREEADIALYPIPIDISEPPGKFIEGTLFEGGIMMLSLTRMQSKKQNDLIDGLLNFDLTSALVICFCYLLISYLIDKLFGLKNKIQDSLFLVYRIMFKEHNISLKQKKGRSLLFFILIYHLMLVFIVETNVNTQLVVRSQEPPIDSLDDLWADLRRKPNFIKDHYSTDHFINSHGNKKAEAIYQRAKKCGCIRDTNNLLITIAKDLRKEIDHNWVIVCDQQMIIPAKKIVCSKDSTYILQIGVLHSSPMIFKTLFSIIHRNGIDKHMKKTFETNMARSFERGIAVRMLEGMKRSNYGWIRNTEIEYKDCITLNYPRSIQDSEYEIKLPNTIILNLFHLFLNACILTLLVSHWIHTLISKKA